MIQRSLEMNRALGWALFTLVFLAPLPFGSVQPWAGGVLEVVVFFLFLVALYGLFRQGRGIRFPLVMPALLFVVLHLLQLIPMPGTVVEKISPASHTIFQMLRPESSRALHETISISPDATVSSLIWFCCCVCACYLAMIVSSNNGSLHRSGGGQEEIGARFLLDIPVRDRREWAALALSLALVLAGTFQAVYGLLEYVLDWNRIFFYVRRYPMGWVAGTFINTNHCAAFLSLCLPPILALILHLRRLEDRNGRDDDRPPDEPSKHSPYRAHIILLAVAAILVSLALLLTHSAGGRLASLAGLTFFFLVYMLHRGRKSSVNLAMVFLMVAIVYFAIVFLLLSPQVTSSELLEDLGWDLQNRLLIYRQSLDIAAAFPLFGSGAGTYSQVMLHHTNRMALHAHNEYLELLCDLGPLGLVCALLLILHLVRRVFAFLRHSPRKRNSSRQSSLPQSYILPLGFAASLFSLGLHCAVDFPLRIPAIALAAATLFGVLSVLLSNGTKE